MIEEISNKKLLDQKVADLKRFHSSFNPSLFSYSISCHYHGIPLHFKCQKEEFTRSLKNFIPSAWITESHEGPFIYLASPQEFGYSFESFSDEASQDCITRENNTLAVQRDFAARIIGDDVFLIAEEKMGDGLFNFLRWYLSEKLMDNGIFVVHSSCVLDKNQEAHLFLGHSNAGKTTITELSSPRLILGDDMNLLSIVDGKLFVEAGAIGGRFNSMIGYGVKKPVKACYWLKQSQVNEKSELGLISANQKLLASFANLHWPTMPESKIEKLMEFSLEAVNNCSFFELKFKKDKSVWEYLDP